MQWFLGGAGNNGGLDLLMNMFGGLGAGGLSGVNQSNGVMQFSDPVYLKSNIL